MRKVYGGGMGLILTAVTTKTVLPVLLVMLPSVMRGAKMIVVAALHALHVEEEHEVRARVALGQCAR